MGSLGVGVGLTVFSTIIASCGALLFKHASKKFQGNPIALVKNIYFLAGSFLYASSAVTFVFALQFGELSTLYPLSGLNYIWISLLSIVLLKENMTRYKWLGIASIIMGVICIGLGA